MGLLCNLCLSCFPLQYLRHQSSAGDIIFSFAPHPVWSQASVASTGARRRCRPIGASLPECHLRSASGSD
ncbi:hypothetical protein KSP40_PGU012985 [Platanthera guangdongensis]|uniref:Uncharacterized protein n=1 Tax=Platanthera guangdongensis TaxID=2320717 RepID=A0ABR2MAP7_9ASPA